MFDQNSANSDKLIDFSQCNSLALDGLSPGDGLIVETPQQEELWL
jgi:hypothetical protein